VSGGHRFGQNTLLNVLSSFIPNDERIVTIENAAELQLRQEHVVRWKAAPPTLRPRRDQHSRPGRELAAYAPRPHHRRGVPRRRSARHAPGHEYRSRRLADDGRTQQPARHDLASGSHVPDGRMDLPIRAIREQLASALDLIVHQERLRDGSRKIVKVTEVQGMEGDMITMSDVFEFEQTGVEGGKSSVASVDRHSSKIHRPHRSGWHLSAAVGLWCRQVLK